LELQHQKREGDKQHEWHTSRNRGGTFRALLHGTCYFNAVFASICFLPLGL